jgi:hypothetical protein
MELAYESDGTEGPMSRTPDAVVEGNDAREITGTKPAVP